MTPEYQQAKSDYEKIRDQIILQRQQDQVAAGILRDINALKKGLQAEPKPKVVTVKARPRHPKYVFPEPRRSKRDRKHHNYQELLDEDYPAPRTHHQAKRRKTSAAKAATEDLSQEGDPKAAQVTSEAVPKATKGKVPEGSPTPECATGRSLRPRKPVHYTEEDQEVPAHDQFIFCSKCQAQKFNGCEEHVPYFADFKDLNLSIETSSVARNAGEGVVNRGATIKEGTLFGPYQGKYFTKEKYKAHLMTNSESGNAWELKDAEGLTTIGYIDPGRNYDPEKNWMAKINCAKNSASQNLVGFQLHGQIYYNVAKDIPNGKELLVWYGNQYAKDLGIDVAKMDHFRGKEFHKTEGIPCPSCNTFFTTELALSQHKATTKVVDGSCQALTGGSKEVLCYRCPEVFPTKLAMLEHCTTSHILPFKPRPLGEKQCPWCLKHYSSRVKMLEHYGEKHCGHGRRDYKCDTCGREFVRKPHLTKHIKNVHQQERLHHCEECGKSFGEAGNLRKHVDAIHLKLKPFVCGWDGCTKAFATADQRRRHQSNLHNGEWRYGCQVCEDHDGTWRGFNTQQELDRHMKRLHPEEWKLQQEAYVASHPHQCNKGKCGKRFETAEEMLRHKVKIHGC